MGLTREKITGKYFWEKIIYQRKKQKKDPGES